MSDTMYVRIQIERRLQKRIHEAAVEEDKQIRQWLTETVEKTLNTRGR